jgi:polyisoprenoid-binding protein YceI
LALPAGLTAGTYAIDAVHSTAQFTIRHIVSKMRGTVAVTGGTITIGEDLSLSSVVATLDARSINTRNEMRDGHLQSADFWDAEKNPTWTFQSTSVSGSGSEFAVTGDLTLNGVTKSVTLDVEFNGAATGPQGNLVAGFEATTSFDRKDFGVNWNAAVEAGGFMLGDQVKVDLTVEGLKQD